MMSLSMTGAGTLPVVTGDEGGTRAIFRINWWFLFVQRELVRPGRTQLRLVRTVGMMGFRQT